ncbi:hypothetical protein ACIBJE_24565 [Micromonospora sp. NPDC050187]|uniref:hypothetical protein n=1 Tax=Micromonospora sp. NPDC050187 TaxID=3364277 RepID=UPI00378817EE
MSAPPTVVTCPDCAGTGCPRCRWRGRRRAQLLLTVANRDTGAVASHRVTPGDLDPRPDPAGGGVADLTPRVRDLAATVAATLDPDPLLVRLPPAWRPDLPGPDRCALAAQALAEAARRPWRLWLGGSTAPSPVDPDSRLARLCGLADLLLLDLVVTARRRGDRLHWTVRYDVPGSPAVSGPVVGSPDLATALVRTDAAEALTGLADRGLTAPARLLGPDRPCPATSPVGPRSLPTAGAVEEVERRVAASAVDSVDGSDWPGAQAVWRDCRWWHTGLHAAVDRISCAVGRRAGVPLGRVAEPPAPARLGDAVPGRPCPDCRPESRPRACRCVTAGRADHDCARCGGTGRQRSALRCATCGGTRRLHRAVLVTLTDLRHRVVHLTWQAGTPEVTCGVAITPGGRSVVVRLPERYRLGAWAAVLGVRPEDLAEADGGHEIPRDLRDGYVTLPWPGADPVGEYVREAGRGLPAARLLVTAVRPDVPPLAEVIRLVVGLDLALHVSLLDLRQHTGHPLRADGRYWSVELQARDAPVHPDDLPTRPTLAGAIEECLTHLADDLAGLVPADPEEPLPVPCSPAREPVADPTHALVRLAAEHAGRAVTVRFTRAGHTAFRHDDDAVRRVELPCVV